MKKAVTIILSDVHYNLQTLKLADAATNMAIDLANKLDVPLVVSGDLHDSKANIRGECVKAMRATFKKAKLKPYVIVGNHCKINEKSEPEEHSLYFLEDLVNIIARPEKLILDVYTPWDEVSALWCIPYYHNVEDLKKYIKTIPKGSRIIMHQGLLGSNTGEYFNDKTSITPGDLSSFRVVSGHYHTRQSVDLPSGGRFDYVGNPYSLTFGEAKDPEKGFQILYDDGSLEFVPTNLRKHVIYDLDASNGDISSRLFTSCNNHRSGDLVYCRIRGNSDTLSKITRSYVSEKLGLEHIRLDLIPTETIQSATPDVTSEALMDTMIDSLLNTEERRKIRLKGLWKDLIDGQE